MEKILTYINKFFAEISGWFLSIITFLLVLNLATRYFGAPIQGLLELSTFAFIAVIYLGLAHCEQNDEHIKVNAIIKRLPEKLQKGLSVFNYIIVILISGVMAYAAYLAMIDAYVYKETIPGTAPLATFPIKITIFVGLVVFCLQSVLHLIKIFKNK